ncbi:NahK/ErcS family hybrid sensor histidine kinase/response regulator [Pontibacterium sp.]|uniref:PAS domain-containing hybrid sensor histidine kinase/response regulator n=1 Tax=Pontibacterium sp. TaxID=2036026 RepID=UPI0035158925
MKKRSDQATVDDLIGLGNQSARKSYYAELVTKIEELEAERNRYMWLFENALHGIFQADLSGGLRAANPAIAKICGYDSADEILAHITRIDQQLFLSPQDFSFVTGCLHSSGHVFGYETRMQRKDGSAVDVSLNVLLKQEGEQQVIEAFVQDITERKKAQDNLKKLNEELEARVEERTRELVSLNDKLWREIAEREQAQKELKVAKEVAEQANISKDKYLAAASHDLLQPMNAARLLVSTLRERELAGEEGHLVERVHLALDNAEELLADLLDISKLDQNAVKPDPAEYSIRALLDPLISEFQTVAQDADLELRCVPSSLNVTTDSRLLIRILRNFLSNAIRYTNEGRVLVGCRRGADTVHIQVWDTGLGIPEDRIQDVFKEFQQLERKKRKRTGVGLGLAIVERIARVLDHPIHVTSQVGVGSMFSIEVPLAQSNEAEPRVMPQYTIPTDQIDQSRVLVIDNEENILVSMAALLGQWGCEVETAADEHEALELIERLRWVPDVIVADYHLDEDQTGTDAVLSIRETLGLDIPAMVITADRSDECRQLFRDHGLPVLNKPVKPGKLRSLLTHLLQS